MAEYPVKHLHSGMQGAPSDITTAAGAVIAVLDAALVTGFGSVIVSDLTVLDGVATVTLSAAVKFDEYAIVQIDGANQPGLNGEHRVATTDDAVFTFATDQPNGTATGTIVARYAPVGWIKEYSDVDTAVYRSSDLFGNRFYYKVVDAAMDYATVQGFEDMNDIDDGIGAFPAAPSAFYKRNLYAAMAQAWHVVADSRFFYLLRNYGVGRVNNYMPAWGCGELKAFSSSDGYAAAVPYSESNFNAHSGSFAMTNGKSHAPRAADGLSGVVDNTVVNAIGVSLSGVSGALFGPYPSTIDGRVITAPVYVRNSSISNSPRAQVPGIRHIAQGPTSGIIDYGDVIIDGDRRFCVFAHNEFNLTSPSLLGRYLIDITGPW